MEVTSLDAVPVSVPKATALRTGGSDDSTAGSDSFDHVLVRAETDAGVVGYGEVAPHPDWPKSGTQATVRSVIEAEFAPVVEGRDPAHVARVAADLEAAVASHPFAVAGVDAALHDALGKGMGRPVYELLGGPTAADRSLPLHHTVGIKPPEAVREEVAAAAERGFSAFKLKVGADDHDADRRRLEAVREACPDARIRVDANGTWHPGEAVRAIRSLNDAADGIVFVEQPVPQDDRAGLRRVRAAVEPSVMADEGCYTPADVAALASADAVDAINVKPAKAGGLAGATRVAAVAAAHGLPCYVGGMLELTVGAAAAAHFALASPERAYPTGLLNADADGALVADPGRWDPDGPTFSVPDDPGLGVSVDTDAVERYRTD
ncbi:mandelate racemase/muconate lactonizing enzyme family protein [Halostella litorea]|uniref:mandelate racemase/muconate lactonizing enzyme family protein n=1 Tax=Halostella litorea TaxID=2528831 RepID=UPI001093063F|nr:enolase C-terminal domain-like protein [Halostella litorea]